MNKLIFYSLLGSLLSLTLSTILFFISELFNFNPGKIGIILLLIGVLCLLSGILGLLLYVMKE